MTKKPRYLVVTPMRNEGPFILEWVAWYKMLGFDDILVLSNDCTDHSPQMLDLLAQQGWLTHETHQPEDGKAPLSSAFRAARAHPLVASAEWMFICDVDEFLVFHHDDGTVQSFVGTEPPDAVGIVFHWKTFGTSRHQTWQDGLVHRMFTRAARRKAEANQFFKTLVHKPARFRRFESHSPKRFDGSWGAPPNVWINSVGQVLEDIDPNQKPLQMTEVDLVSHRNAQVNHYVIRTRENYTFKKGRLSASSLKNRYTDRFLKKFNRNDVTDTSAQRYHDAFDAVYAKITAEPGIMRLHHQCCADYIAEMCEKRGDDPYQDARFISHMSQAVPRDG